MKRDSIVALICLIFAIALGTLMAPRASGQEPSRTGDHGAKGAALRLEKMESSWERDPFLLPRGVYNLATPPKDVLSKPDEKPKDIPLPSLEVKAILISNRLRLASMDHQIVTVGDMIRDEKVLEIQKDRVVMGKGDKKRNLLLKQSPVRFTIDDGERKGETR